MKISSGSIYHIYNRGNNRTDIFFDNNDYLEFFRLFRKTVFPKSKILAYCLMPNHFHFLALATDISANKKRIGKVESCELSNAFRMLQSSYAQYFNKRNGRSGSLFRQKAKAKCISDGDENYLATAFQYIHQNPIKAGLVSKIEDWPYSSMSDYLKTKNGSICDLNLVEEFFGRDTNFLWQSYQFIDEKKIQLIF